MLGFGNNCENVFEVLFVNNILEKCSEIKYAAYMHDIICQIPHIFPHIFFLRKPHIF